MFGFTPDEVRIFTKLKTPEKVQDFLESIPINFEPDGDTCISPRRVLREGRAHCIEGAMLAAAAFMVHGEKPLLFDLRSAPHDHDHVVALFKKYGRWGAVSKTNHAVLRYREPVYMTLRELALSYFHEYFTDDGKKTMREFSTRPFDLSTYISRGWMTSEEDVWYVPEDLDDAPHESILQHGQARTLRLADPIEIEVGKSVVWKKKKTPARSQEGAADVMRTRVRTI